MARPTWSGTLQFGLVSVPIKLFPAVQEKSVHFHYVHDEDGGRIHEKRVCAKDGKEVAYEHIARAYEVSKGKQVVFTPQELAKLSDEKNGACEIDRFVNLAEIDPVYFAASYYAVPDKGAGKSFQLLSSAMRKAERVGIGSIVLRTRENPIAVRATDDGLMVSVLHHGDEVRARSELDAPAQPKGKPVTAQELKMAEQLISQLTGKFDPGAFKDRYRERVEEMARTKAKGGTVEEETEAPAPEKTLDLMEALRQSLAGKAHRPARAAHRGAAKPRPAAAAATPRARRRS